MADAGTLNISFNTDVATLINDMRRAGRAVQSGARQMQQSLLKADRAVKTLISGYAGLATVRGIGRISDDYTDLSNKLRVVAKDQGDFEKSLAGVAKISRETFSSLSGTAQTYSRLSIATKDLGYSSQQVLDITKALNQTFRISGASTQETAAASIQLAQGLASGALKGDELRSVLENNAILGNLLAKELNTNVGELRDMAAEGKLTAEIVGGILLRNLEDLNAQAEKIAPTFSKALSVVKDQFALGFGASANSDLQAMATGFAENSSKAYEFGLLLGKVTSDLVGVGREIGKIITLNGELGSAWNLFGFAAQNVLNSIRLGLLLTQRLLLELLEKFTQMIDYVIGYGNRIATDLGRVYVELAAKIGFVDKELVQFAEAKDYSGNAKGIEVLRAGMTAVSQEIDEVSAKQKQLTKDFLAGDSFSGLKAGNDSGVYGPVIPPGASVPSAGSAKGLSDEAKKIKAVVEQLKFRNEQMGRNEKEQEVYNQIRAAGVSIDSQAGQQIAVLVDQYYTMQDALASAAETQKKFSDKASEAIQDHIDRYKILDSVVEQSIRGQISSWKDLGSAIVSELQNILVAQLQLGSSSGSGGSAFSSLLSIGSSLLGFGGGLSSSSLSLASGSSALFPSGISLFATGGVTDKPAIFGEAGAEAAVPLPDGRRIPVDLRGGGASGGTFYIDARGADSAAIARLEATITSINGNLEKRSVAAVANEASRNPSFLR